MPTYTRTLTWVRNFTAGKNTSQCFSGSDASSTATVTVGGDLTTKEKVRNWRRKIALGQQATGNLAGNQIDLDYSSGSCSSRKWCNNPLSLAWAYETVNGYLESLSGNLACPDAPVGSIDSTANALALTRFNREIRNAQGSFRGSTVVAELADTLRGIRNPAKGIRDLLDFYHSRARSNIRKAMGRDPLRSRVSDLSPGQFSAGTKALSDSWLEAQFGILPLMSDVRAGIDACKQFGARDARVPVRGSGQRDTDWVFTSKTTQTQNVEFKTSIMSRTEFSVRYYGAVKLTMGSFTSALGKEFGFMPRDFFPALWEWMPYSFLVDYFTNIGDLLEAASINRADMAWVGRVWRNTAVRDGTRQTVKPLFITTYPTSGYTEITGYSPSQVTWRRKCFAREPYNGTLCPGFLLEIPGFRNTKRWLNIAALLRLRGMRR